MSTLNMVMIVGNLGRDPELNYTAAGIAVCTLSLATSRKWKDKTSGEMQEETEWHRVVVYDRLAEIAGEYLKKGKPALVIGRLKTRKWTDKEGVERYTTEIIANELKLLGGSNNEDVIKPAPEKPVTKKDKVAAIQAAAKQSSPFADMDSDIPF